MILQSSAVLSGMPLLLVVSAMKALITPQGVSTHLVRPFEVWLILDLLQNLMHWFSEHNVYYLKSCRPRLPGKIPLRSVIIIEVRPEIPSFLNDNLSFPLPCCYSSSTLLYLSIQTMSWGTLVTGFPVKDFLKSCLVGRSTLKVLMATLSKSPSISLNIS